MTLWLLASVLYSQVSIMQIQMRFLYLFLLDCHTRHNEIKNVSLQGGDLFHPVDRDLSTRYKEVKITRYTPAIVNR